MLGWALLAGAALGYEAVVTRRQGDTLSRAAWRLRDHRGLGWVVPAAIAALAWHVLADGPTRPRV